MRNYKDYQRDVENAAAHARRLIHKLGWKVGVNTEEFYYYPDSEIGDIYAFELDAYFIRPVAEWEDGRWDVTWQILTIGESGNGYQEDVPVILSPNLPSADAAIRTVLRIWAILQADTVQP